ncbi:MAG TPA: hypothetical protein VFN67_27325 [Polyangiales bacterium]|jgi:D-alanine-D-alanine ligase|nr:hypothetical protein [Polyangiales bacterium]
MRARCNAGQHSDNPKNWDLHIIEVNPNPYLEEHAEVAMAAKQHGLSYSDLLEKILESAERRALRS